MALDSPMTVRRDEMTAKGALVMGGILMSGAVGQIAVSIVADRIATTFVPHAKARRSGARGDGNGAWR